MSSEPSDDVTPERVAPAALGSGWQRYVFPSIWLIYLASTVDGVHKHSSGGAAVIGYVLVGAFAVVYACAGPAGWSGRYRTFWLLFALGHLLLIAELFFAQESAFVFLVYLGVLIMASELSFRFAVVALYAIANTFIPVLVGWTTKPAWEDGFTIVLVSFAMFGFFHIIAANRELSAARAEVARLAAEGERSRIARDLHDLLGHSLTTITVKAGLARRLAERGDSDRALDEIREVEQLSRRTLGDVRAAVAGHHEMTLAGELATAREVLRAAGVVAELPGSIDVVQPQFSEVFGWVLREGVTNLVRHAHAPSAKITLGPRWIEIADTGNGGPAGCGSGLRGLRERIEAVGGTLTATSTFTGFKLRAEVSEQAGNAHADPAPPAPAPAPVDAADATDVANASSAAQA